MFDLPVTEAAERKSATQFRNRLLDMGFEMAQFSVYLKHCTGPEHADTLSKRVERALPQGGKVDILKFTDKQYERIQSFRGRAPGPERKNPEQHVLF